MGNREISSEIVRSSTNTGLFNATYLESRLHDKMELFSTHGQKFCVMVIDVSNSVIDAAGAEEVRKVTGLGLYSR